MSDGENGTIKLLKGRASVRTFTDRKVEPEVLEAVEALPEAQKDRFMLMLKVPYPERDDEVDLARRTLGRARRARPEWRRECSGRYRCPPGSPCSRAA